MPEMLLAPPPLPMISRTEVHHRHPWVIIAGSLQGPVKAGKADPELNDDAFRIGAVGNVSWAIVADGVGSAAMASAGAHYATYYLDRFLASVGPERAATSETLLKGYRIVREQLALHAVQDRRKLADYATTLLVAVLTESRVLLARTGDGLCLTMDALADGKDAFHQRACSAKPADPDGDVTPITDPAWEQFWSAEVVDIATSRTTAVVLATDGAETFFVSDQQYNTALISKFTTPILNQPDKGLRYASPILHRMFINVIDNPPTYNKDDRTFAIATLNHCGHP